VDYELHLIHVNTACRNIRGDKHLRGAVGEGFEVALSSALGQISVEVDRGDTRLAQVLRQLLRTELRTCEEQ
jgi:hypothetical protein